MEAWSMANEWAPFLMTLVCNRMYEQMTVKYTYETSRMEKHAPVLATP